MYIRKSNGLKIERCETPTSTDDQLELWPLRTTRWILLFKKLLSKVRWFSEIPTHSSLNTLLPHFLQS